MAMSIFARAKVPLTPSSSSLCRLPFPTAFSLPPVVPRTSLLPSANSSLLIKPNLFWNRQSKNFQLFSRLHQQATFFPQFKSLIGLYGPKAVAATEAARMAFEQQVDWNCEACTFANEGSSETCGMCGAVKVNSAWDGFPVNNEVKEWACRACTFLNRSAEVTCAICLAENAEFEGATLGSTVGAFRDESRLHDDDDTRIHKSPESTTSRLQPDNRDDAEFVSNKELPLVSENAGMEESMGPQELQRNGLPVNKTRFSEKSLSPASGSASFNHWLGSAVTSRGLKRNFSVDVDSEAETGDRKRALNSLISVTNGVPSNEVILNEIETNAGTASAASGELAKITEDPSETENKLLASLHALRAERKARRENAGPSEHSSKIFENAAATATEEKMNVSKKSGGEPVTNDELNSISILTYNVWFREDLEVERRMAAIGAIIEQHSPHVLCFQEITSNIYRLLQSSKWWKQYQCSVSPGEASKRTYFTMQLSRLPVKTWHQEPFRNSGMGRELSVIGLKPESLCNLLVATTHLESPCPAPPKWDQMFSKERVAQAKMAFVSLQDMQNVVFCGDMNWDDKGDGPPPLPSGWSDAWLQLHPDQVGYTYDGKANAMLGGRLQKRLDRVFSRLRDFEVESLQMVGTEAIPGLTYEKEKKVKRVPQMVTLPVYPSDHFGLLLKLRRK